MHAQIKPASLPDAPRSLVPVFALLLLIFALSGAGGLAWASRMGADRVSHTLVVRQQASEMFTLLLDAESGQRGFVASRQDAFLEPYTQGIADLPAASDALRVLVSDNRAQIERLDRIDALVAQELEVLRQNIDLARVNTYADAQPLAILLAAKAIMDEARGQFDAFQKAEIDLLAERRAWSDRLNIAFVAAILLAVLGAAMLGMAHLESTRRGLAASARANRDLDGIVRARTGELQAVAARLEAALKASGITVLDQDADLRFTYLSKPLPGLVGADAIGLREDEAVPPELAPILMKAKLRILATANAEQLELRLAKDGVEQWLEVRIKPKLDEAGRAGGLISVAIDITQRKKAEAHVRLLMREVMHRSKNTLAVVQAMARQSAPSSISIPDFIERFSSRLAALAGSYDLLVQESWEGASLDGLVRSQLGHYADLIGTQIEVKGPPLRLTPAAAQNIGMALHELGTNAAKFGSLSVPGGRVRICWSINNGGTGPRLEIAWRESGGPPVAKPAQTGFGQLVVKRMAASALDADVALDYAPGGIVWTLDMPMAHVLA